MLVYEPIWLIQFIAICFYKIFHKGILSETITLIFVFMFK